MAAQATGSLVSNNPEPAPPRIAVEAGIRVKDALHQWAQWAQDPLNPANGAG
jgi:hypothetical protein